MAGWLISPTRTHLRPFELQRDAVRRVAHDHTRRRRRVHRLGAVALPVRRLRAAAPEPAGPLWPRGAGAYAARVCEVRAHALGLVEPDHTLTASGTQACYVSCTSTRTQVQVRARPRRRWLLRPAGQAAHLGRGRAQALCGGRLHAYICLLACSTCSTYLHTCLIC